MYKILLAACAAIALSGAASGANATADNFSVQFNDSPQTASVSLNQVNVTGAGTIKGQAIGNSLSVVSSTPPTNISTATARDQADVRSASVQVNLNTTQRSDVDVTNSGFGSLDASSQAVGNATSLETTANFDPGFHHNAVVALAGPLAPVFQAQNDGSIALQVNQNSDQIATLDGFNVTVNGVNDMSSTAVGNTSDFSAGRNGTAEIGQLNNASAQYAAVNLTFSSIQGASNLQAQSIGNIGAWQADSADALALQGNTFSTQVAAITVGNTNFGSNATFGATAAGNVINVHTGPVAP